METLEYVFLKNPVLDWLYAGAAALGLLVVLYVVKNGVLSRVRVISSKTSAVWDDALVSTLEKTRGFFLLAVSLYFGSQFLVVSPRVGSALSHAIFLIALLQVAVWGVHLISYLVDRSIEKKRERDLASTTTMGLIRLIANAALFVLLFLVALNNLGIDITALVAGLGVGGIAIALAVQNILGDLFASLTIVLDKPFVVGDFIIVGDFLGTIEKIGLKTTRIRSLSGEQLIFSNNDLLQSRIRNYKRMYERRVVFQFRVTYQTTEQQLAKIPSMIKSIIETHELTRFDRSHFSSYGLSSLDFETVYWIKSPDFNAYMDVHQAINLEIFRQFKQAGIKFAYPTQTIYMGNGMGNDDRDSKPQVEVSAPIPV